MEGYEKNLLDLRELKNISLKRYAKHKLPITYLCYQQKHGQPISRETKTWIANIKGNKATNAPTDEKATVHEDTKHSKKETKEKEHCIEVPTFPFQYNNDKKSFLAPWVDYWNGPQTQA